MDNMFDYKVPIRGKLLKMIYVACKVNPLARPRANFFTKAVYQPLERQKELRDHIRQYADHCKITCPVVIDCYFSYTSLKSLLMARSGDIDNLTKAVYDALICDYGKKGNENKILDNDILVLGGETYKVIGEEGCLIKIWSASYDNNEQQM